MKKYILITLVLLITGFVFTTCEDNEHFIPKDTPSVFHFLAATAAVNEAVLDKDGEFVRANTLTLTVMWSKHHPTGGTIDLEVKPISEINGNPVVPAIEGVDYTISTKKLTFPADGDGMYKQTVDITTKYDPTFTGSKNFEVKISDANVDGEVILGAYGAPGSVMVSIGDVNHPFTALIGNVKLKADRYNAATTEVNAIIAPDPDDTNVLWLTTNLHSNATYNTPLKMNAKTTDDGYEVSIKFPQKSGNYSATQTAWWFATYWIDAEDDWDATLDEYTITGTTGKDKMELKFDGAFVLFVTNNDSGSILGYLVNYLIPRTLVISKE